jgi:pimeloyl-ACP methyl ester carboxylesterase
MQTALIMEASINKHGDPPFRVVLVHGGPGAAGELTMLASELAEYTSILEPFQTKLTIEDLVTELDEQVSRHAELPVTLVGHSWGAWLCFLYATKYNEKVRKLILISSGPLDATYASDIINTRVKRLTDKDRKRLFNWIERLNEPDEDNKNDLFRQVGELIYRADSFDPIPGENPEINYNYNMYLKVWNEAQELRSSGALLSAMSGINCPVVAIHGDYDPHPAEGIRGPLTVGLKDFKFHLLRNCGHHPWEEKLSKDKFFSILAKHLIH